MLPKIRYRLVWNYANKLNAQGMAIVSVGYASVLQILHETHGGAAQCFYVGNEAKNEGVRLQSNGTTLTITSFIDTQTNQLKVAYIKF